MLVMEAMRQFDEVARLRQELAPGGDALIATELSSDSEPSKLEREIMMLCRRPTRSTRCSTRCNLPISTCFM